MPSSLRRRIAPVVGAVVALLAVSLVTVVLLAPRGSSDAGAPGRGGGSAVPEEPAPRWAAPAAPPDRATVPAGPGTPALVDPAWVERTAAATGIPPRALTAYSGAAIAKADQMPDCGISWATIAGIGFAESDHGRHDDARVGTDGVVAPPIFGIPLDGTASAAVPDSDAGGIDGDPTVDRAVGPMQFIPQAWRNWHVDADADGVENPHDIDDAALATANYLCRVSRGMDAEAGWRTAIAGYNSSSEYRDRVARAAAAYAAA